jgi:hypothetical protein
MSTAEQIVRILEAFLDAKITYAIEHRDSQRRRIDETRTALVELIHELTKPTKEQPS